MPQMTLATVDSQTRSTFDRYWLNLLSHEHGHLNFGVLAANDIEKLLQNNASNSSCSALGQHYNEQAKLIVTQYGLQDDAYDERTQHGKTQGAYIYDLLP